MEKSRLCNLCLGRCDKGFVCDADFSTQSERLEISHMGRLSSDLTCGPCYTFFDCSFPPISIPSSRESQNGIVTVGLR